MSATIRDVAKKAGVSPSTVSKALNESSAVSADTMKKIQQAVKVLNYQPNARARSFATRVTMHIVFLADFPYDAAFVNPHLFEIMRGVQHSLDKKGYALIMKQADAKSAYAYTETAAAQHQVDGFIFHASVVSKKLASLVTRENIPHVVIGRPNIESRMCWIDTDNHLSGEQAAQHLLDLGHTNIAIVNGKADDMISWRRLLGAKRVYKENGVDIAPAQVIQTTSSITDGARAVKKLLHMNPRPTAVICANNPLALGVLQELQNRGIRVPEDMALITYDSYPFAMFSEPAMTAVDINMYDMGQEAARLVLRKMRHPEAQIQSYTTMPTLIQRETT